MKKIVLLIIMLIFSGILNCKEQISKEKQQMLAYGAVLTVRNNDNFIRLGTDITSDKEVLKNYWKIDNRKIALTALEYLVNEGHRSFADEILIILKNDRSNEYIGLDHAKFLYEQCNKMLISEFNIDKKILNKVTTTAWDSDRLVNVARWCYDAKYISEEEAWKYIEKAKIMAQNSFDSWEEYYVSYVYGRSLGYNGDPAELLQAGENLLKNKDSIWERVAFK